MSALPLQASQVGSNRLPVIAASINEHLTAAEAATRRGLEHAIAAGLLLIEAKELVGHGEWLAWLQANCQIGQRQAQTYMRLTRNRHRLEAVKSAATAHLTIAAAEALVGRSKPERSQGLPGQLDLLGGPEVTAPPPTADPVAASILRDRDRLVHLIGDLEQAHAVLKDEVTDLELAHALLKNEGGRKRNDKKRSRFRPTASTVGDAIAYLKELSALKWMRHHRRHGDGTTRGE
jgi:Protein of unknown function (DUF3102)